MDSGLSALHIKTKLIDFILNRGSASIIGNEVMYGKRKSLVDILELSNNKTIVYEIKASKDDFRKLAIQISEYKKVFDYIYIVITPNHLSKINKEYDDIGIIVIDFNDNISYLKKARLQQFNDKTEILSTMNADFLKKRFEISLKTDASQTRILGSKKPISKIKTMLYEYLYQNIYPKFKLFLAERGKDTLIDDIPILSLHRKKII